MKEFTRKIVTLENLMALQIETEERYDKKNIRAKLIAEMEHHKPMNKAIKKATKAIIKWTGKKHYASKTLRLEILAKQDIKTIIQDVMVQIIVIDGTELLSAVVGQCTGLLEGYEDHRAAVTTMGEILVFMCEADLFDLDQAERMVTNEGGLLVKTTSFYVNNTWELEKETAKFIEQTRYLPPMLVRPVPLTDNKSSGYLTTESETLILGKGNHHSQDICLDSLNSFNRIPLALNEEMLIEVTHKMMMNKEKRKAIKSNPDRARQHEKLMKDSYHIYVALIEYGNRFYLTHKTDKRGRTYAGGYHCTTQGNSFHKAIIELADKEIVNGSL